MFESLIGKECKFNVARFGDCFPYSVEGCIQKVYEDFLCIKTKKDVQYLAIKY